LEGAAPPTEGIYIHGLFIEGAAFDSQLGSMQESEPKVEPSLSSVCCALGSSQCGA